MANRIFKQNSMLTLENKVVHLFAKVAIGGSGAPTMTEDQGIASFVRDSAGKYTVMLSDKYKQLRAVVATPLLASTTALAAPNMKVVSETVSSTKTIVLEFHDIATPAATELGNGEVWRFMFVLSD